MNLIANDHKTKNLMLLVGTNPLPNYVAARLLDNPETGTKLHLVITDEVKIMGIPQRLLELLGKKPSDQEHYLPVRAADPDDIFTQVYKQVKTKPGSWGLHYTGGKKVMAAHAYRAMERALAESCRAGQGVFSYLDADSLEMVIQQEGKGFQYCSSALDEPLMLWQLIFLHGKPEKTVDKARWDDYPENAFINRPLGEKYKPHRVPFRPDLCEKLKNARISDNHAVFDEMRAKIPALSIETGQTETDLKNWINKNYWLEHYVLDQLLQIRNECGITDYVLGFESEIFGGEKNFESDVLVMQGYRLFYITITTGGREKENKWKLFEGYIRAQQLGGEQAKVALVTLSPYVNATTMENELHSDLHLNGKVFDREHLDDSDAFRDYLRDWLK